MAYVLRLMLGLVCVLGWHSGAHALIPQSTQVGVVSGTTIVATGPTKLAACQAWADKFYATSGYRPVVDDGPIINTQCNIKLYFKSDGGYVGTSTWPFTTTLACPINSTLSGSQCQCNSGYVEDSAKIACELPPDPCKDLKGQYAGNWWKDQGDSNGLPTKVGFSVCDRYNNTGGGLCVLTVGEGPDTLCAQASGGYWQCNGPGYYTGSKAADAGKCTVGAAAGSGASPSDPAPASPPISENPPKPPPTPAPGTAAPAPCPSGQAPGQVNGSTICAPMGSDRPTASGTGSSTTKNNSDGSSTTSTSSGTTKCEGGQCTSITNNTNTTINAPGNSACPSGQTSGTTTVNGQSRTTCTATSSGTSTQPQATFCKDNPKDKQCGGDGADTAFGGSCAGGFKGVSDDAVINAMAEEQYRRNCQFFEKAPEATEESGAYEEMKAKAKAGTDLTDGMDSRFKRTVSIGPGDFDSSSAIGVSACIRDVPIVMSGLTITLPFSRVCPYLEYIGTLLTVVAYLLAARIVVRG